MQPQSLLVSFDLEGTIALSANTSSNTSLSGQNAYSGHHGWDSSNWVEEGCEEE